MFLKSESFTFNGETVTLFELSALHRIQYLQYLSEDHQKQLKNDIDEEARNAMLIEMNIRAGAIIVAMSLWQGDRTGPSVESLQQEIMATWPLKAIGDADNKVKTLSGMIPPPIEVASDSPDDVPIKEVSPSAEKPSPVS